MDEFAQTRPPDDLFDDDFTPIAEPSTQPSVSSGLRQHRGYGRSQRGSRGRGRGRGGSSEGASADSKAEEVDGDADPHQPARGKDEGRPEAVKGDRSGTGGVKMVRDTRLDSRNDHHSQSRRQTLILHVTEKTHRGRTHGSTGVYQAEECRAGGSASSGRSRRGLVSETRAARGHQATGGTG